MKCRSYAIFSAVILLFSGISFSFAGGDIRNVEIENAWKDETGHYVIEFKYKSHFRDSDTPGNPDFFGTNLSFYGDEEKLFQLETAGYGGTSSHHVFSFTEPRIEGGGQFLIGVEENHIFKKTDKVELICGSDRVPFVLLSDTEKSDLLAQVRSEKIKTHALPTSERKSEYLFKSKNTDIYTYVDASRYQYSYESFRMWVGAPQKMKEIKITAVDRFRDGGTTVFITAGMEKLYTPTPFDESQVSTWNDRNELVKLDPDHFDLSSLGIAGVPSIPEKLHTPCDRFFKSE